MIILGIDPGINCTGWAIINIERNKTSYIASGAITSSATYSLGNRLAKICQDLNGIIDTYKPHFASIEEVFVNKNPQSSLKLSHARGALMATIALKNIPLYEFSPNQIKKTVVGVGHAEKSQIQHMIQLLVHGTKACKADEADAIAIAYTCSVMTNFTLVTTAPPRILKR